MSGKKILTIVSLLAIITLASIIYGSLSNNYGYADIQFQQQPNVSSFSATLNNQPFSLSGVDSTYKIKAGIETLIVTGNGYSKFSASFAVQKNKTVYINVAMQSSAPKTAAEATQQLQSSLVSSLPSNFTIQSANYFYGNTWAVLTVQTPDGDVGILVSRYDVVSKQWVTALGPGTLFDSSDMSNLPSQVSSYMYQQNYAVPGGQ